MNRPISYLIFTLLFLACCRNRDAHTTFPISIDVWYGYEQYFGKLGLSQKWINILGNVHSDNGIQKLSYALNQSEFKPLALGSDLHRLASYGDFNVDIDIQDCEVGKNSITLLAIDSAGNRIERIVSFTVEKDKTWPLPYTIQWSEINEIEDAVQVVDGNWEITENGLHNIDTYYDRVVAFGDASWENYEVSTTVTFHSFTPPVKGPPTYNVSHVAIATRWPGHDIDKFQPHRTWYPLGATAEFRLTAGLDSCRWRIFDGPKPDSIRFYVEQDPKNYRKVQLDRKYGIKHRVESIDERTTRYSVKMWAADMPEPQVWDLIAVEKGENIFHGSALLLAHNTNVTFGDVKAVPITDR